MKNKFRMGDKVVVNNVRDASAVGYLGSFRRVRFVFNTERGYRYYAISIDGTGGAWFDEDELIRVGSVEQKK